MEFIYDIDFWLFQFINSAMANDFFDLLMPYLRNRDTWIPLYIIIAFYLAFRFRRRAFLIIFFAIAAVGAADGLSSHIIKPLMARIRPCHVLEHGSEIILRLNHCSAGFSFPSSHAANHFALAIFLGMLLYNNNYWFWRLGILWAATILFVQVYVGVHFPFDVFFGAILGSLLGALIFKIYQQIELRV